MKISSLVDNSEDRHLVTLRTDDHTHHLTIAPKPTGFGSSANGGDLLKRNLLHRFGKQVRIDLATLAGAGAPAAALA